MKYTCPNGHGDSDIYPVCHTCEAKMIDNSKAPEAPKAVEPVIVEEAAKEEVVEEEPKKKKK